MVCESCGEKPKDIAKDFTKAVIEINNPGQITLIRRVVIPATMGDDTTVPPVVGKYHNVLLYYEANHKSYLYSSDGIPTLLVNGVTDYEQAVNLPQINGVTLIGDKSAVQLRLQDKLTAGDNISIDDDNVISAVDTTYGPATDAEIGLVKPGTGLEVDADGTLSISDIEQYAHFFDTVADMKAATNLVAGDYAKTAGFYSVNDGGGALYKITDTGTANEMDVIAVGTLFANLLPNNMISIKAFGAKQDVVDNASVIASAMDFCYNNSITLCVDMQVYFSSPLTITDVPNIICTKPLIYTGAENTIAITLGDSTKEQDKLYIDLSVINNSKSTTITGAKLVNINTSTITMRTLSQFGVGAVFSGDSKGSCYNIVNLLHIFYNDIGIKLLAENNGWCNENLFNGGKFQYRNTEDYSSTIGVKIEGSSAHRINNNLFVKPAFEFLNIGVDATYASQNNVYNGRFEKVNYCARFNNECRANKINVGYGTNQAIIGQQTNTVTTLVGDCLFSPIKIYENNIGATSEIRDSGGTNRLYLDDATVMNSGGSTTTSIGSDGNYALSDGYLEQIVTKKGIGVFVDCSKAKYFYVEKETALGYPGRFYVKFYDVNDAAIPTATTVSVDASVGLAATNDISESFRTTIDLAEGIYVKVPEDAKKVFIGVTRVGDYNIKIKTLKIWADRDTTYSTTI